MGRAAASVADCVLSGLGVGGYLRPVGRRRAAHSGQRAGLRLSQSGPRPEIVPVVEFRSSSCLGIHLGRFALEMNPET